jgi:hypothetical protein
MTVVAGWIKDRWIFSNDQSQSEKFWIQDDWIWGPVGSGDLTTRHWISEGWIYRVDETQAHQTGFHIQDGYIFGPGGKLPFA